MPKPHTVVDPFTGKRPARDVTLLTFEKEIRERPETFQSALGLTERRAERILRGRGSIRGERIA